MTRPAAFALGLAALLLGGAAPAGQMLVASDLHFDPLADPALVDTLAAAPTSGWQAILEGGRRVPAAYGRDTPWPLLRSALDAMAQALPRPALVVLAGDFLAHDFRAGFDRAAADHGDAAYGRFVEKTIGFVGLELQQRFPDTPIVATLGNNDDACGDYKIAPGGPFLAGTADTVRGLARLGPDAAFETSWRRSGGYVMPHPALAGTSIVALNTVFFSTHYRNDCGAAGIDPAAEALDWLDRVLGALQAGGHKAWLVYHIPPGIDGFSTRRAERHEACADAIQPMWQPAIEARFEALMAQYADTVTASLAGHTHMDEFRLVGPAGAPVGYVLGVPGVSPVFGQNPGFRVVDYDAAGGLADARTFALTDLGAGSWSEEYDFDRTYGLDRIDLPGLATLAHRLAAEPGTRARWSTLYAVSRPGQTAAAEPAFVCAVANSRAADYRACACGG